MTTTKSTRVRPSPGVKLRHKIRIMLVLWMFWFAYLCLTHEVQLASGIPTNPQPGWRNSEDPGNPRPYTSALNWRTPDGNSVSRVPLMQTLGAPNPPDNGTLDDSQYSLVPGYNCTNPAILEFPPDLFTQKERQGGAILIHFLASIYVFYAFAIICDDYFVPSIERICDELNVPSDVAGATFMAIASSSPELFTNVVGTFITAGDIGLGAIVGSAVFNVLAVCACCGFAASTALPLDWYPLTRDCLFYSISVLLLIRTVENRRVFWYEALILVMAYVLYIIVMWKNTALKRISERIVRKIGSYCRLSPSQTQYSEKTPLLTDSSESDISTAATVRNVNEDLQAHRKDSPDPAMYDEILSSTKTLNEKDVETENYGVFSFPSGEGCWTITEWVLGWPARIIFTLTIPDCRKARFRKFYPLTFIMCIVYIAFLSYVVSWLMTVIGFTFGIPDSVMGLTFIAAGASVPEVASSIIVAKQGMGSMSISNSIGSNIFDILICLGLPWLIKSAMIANDAEENYIQINSGGIQYSIITLIISVLLLYGILAANGFYLDKKVATIATVLYAIFLTFAVLLEMNFFFQLNQPMCSID